MDTDRCTYRKTKTGKWAVMGPTSIVRPGATVTVTKKSGETKSETIDDVGRPFTVDGRQMVYGYTSQRSSRGRSSASGRYANRDACGYPCPVDGHICTPGNPCHDCF